MGGMDTLRTDVAGIACVGSVGTFTLGDATTGAVSDIGIGSILFSCVDIFNSAFLTGSSAVRLGVVFDGGEVRILIISTGPLFEMVS